MSLTTLTIEERIIKDPDLISKYDNEFNGNFYVPPEEKKSLDYELIQSEAYTLTAEKIGQLDPIYVSICETDKLKERTASIFRVHGRILDGRHKYEMARKAQKVWRVVYVIIKDFLDFDELRTYFATHKSPEKQTEDRKMIIDQRCRYYYDVVGMFPKSSIGRQVVRDLTKSHSYSKRAIYKMLDPQYLDQKRSKLIKDGMLKHSIKKLSKKDKLIAEMNIEMTEIIRENIILKLKEKPDTEKDIIIKELESKNEKLKRDIFRLEAMVEKKPKGKLISCSWKNSLS